VAAVGPFLDFLSEGRDNSASELDDAFVAFATGKTPEVKSAPATLGEEFSAGVEAGAQGLRADLEYFKALGNTLIGDKSAAADNIAAARLREDLAAAPLAGIETFAEFLDQPTFSGFLTQVTKGTGQIVPSAALSIASAGAGAVAAITGRAVLNQVGQQAAKRIVKDSVERTARGVADPTEQQIAELAYGSLRSAAKKGAIAGAFGAEFAPMSGDNLSEALESGKELDRGTAFRAAAVGVPQAAIGVGGEVALVKLIGQAAAKRATKEGGVFANLAKDLGTGFLKGGAIEGSTELVQEGISVANRMQMDPTFTTEEANLRLAEAAFVGFFGGGAVGGAGSGVGGLAGSVSATDTGKGVIDATANVFDKARRLLDRGQEQRVNDQINEEQFGDMFSGNTTPEPEGDINAQLRAMVDRTSGKNSVWIAGEASSIKARTNRPTEIVVDGNEAFAAFIPGRGTIISTDRAIVEEVISSKASDQALQIALGYSAVKDASNPGDLVVQVFDRDGRVISEEVTNNDGLPAAFQAAGKLMPEGGRISQTTVEKAIEDRKRRFEAERKVEVRDMELFESLPPEQQEELRRMRDGLQQDEGQVDEVAADEDTVDRFGQGIQEIEGQRTIVGAYGRKKDPSAIFDNTAAARANFESVFGETNWGDPRFAAMNESLLNLAANEQRTNPDSAVSIEDTPDGGFQLVRDDFGDLFRNIDKKGNESRLNLTSFLAAAIQRAKRSKYARGSRVTVVGPDGKKSPVNLVDLTRGGQRLIEGQDGFGFMMQVDRKTGDSYIAPQAAARAGYLAMVSELLLQGYDVQVDGQSILQNNFPKQLGTVTAAIVGSERTSLNALLKPPTTSNKPSLPELIIYEQQDVGVGQRPEPKELRRISGPLDKLLEVQARYEKRGYDTELRGPGVERDEDLAGGSEIDRMMESGVRGDELLTPMNIDTPVSAIDRRPAAGSKARPEIFKYGSVALALEGMTQEIIKDLLKVLNFKDPPQIFSFAKLSELTSEQLDAAFPDAGMRAAVQTALDSMRAKDSLLGKHISGPAGKVIIIRESGNALQDALVTAHEIGHSLYKEERDKALSNKALRERLIKAYKNSPTFKELSEKYGFDRGFEEWFSDQVSLWANQRYKNRQPKNLGDKFFKDFVAQLNKLWRALSDTLRKRFKQGVNEDFERFMDAVLESRRTQVNENGLGFTEKAFAYELNDMAVQTGGEALAQHWRGSIKRMLKNPAIKPLMKFVRTADGILRTYAGSEIADMFYVRSQQDGSEGRLGMIRAAARKNDELQNKFRNDVGQMDDPEVVAAMEAAASSTPTNELPPRAQQVRKFLEDLYDDYILPSNTDINRQENYFPVALNLLEILGRPEEFTELILANNPGVNRQTVSNAVNKLMRVQQAILDDGPITIDPSNPASDVVQAIKLTRGIPREIMQEAGFLQPPTDALINYVRHVVKRVEFDRATKDANGRSRLQELLGQLQAEDRALAEEIISTYLGYQANPLSPFWRKVNSWGQFIQFVTILPFATLASLTDLAGPVINSKEFAGVTMGLKEIIRTIKNRAEAEQLARDIGVVTQETVANAWVTEAEQDYMDPKVRKMSDAYFRAIGLSFFTRFSREFATGMGVQFITKHARNEFNNPRSERYLRELGLNREDVLAWIDGGRSLTTPEGLKVKQALQRFVESSILRPNAAERPVWASDPHWALVWQLKAFFYSYGKVILGGLKNEAANRLRETPGTPMEKIRAAGTIFALTAVATMPLAMMGLELREYAKYGMAWLLPGIDPDRRYFRSDRMDWPEYAAEIFDRSGFAGPMAMVAMANQSAEWGKNPLFTLLGPTAETVEEIFANGWQVDRTIKNRLLPLYNQL
jgi:hypothetical protein